MSGEDTLGEHPDLMPNKGSAKKAPVRPVAAQQVFVNEKMKKAMINQPQLTKAEAIQKLKKKWVTLDSRKKMKYINLALDLEKTYKTELEQYRKDHPEFEPKPHRAVLTKADEKVRDLHYGKPAKPPNSGYAYISSMLLSQLKELPPKERMGEISRRWKGLSEKERDQYNKQAEQKRRQYKQELENYLRRQEEEALKASKGDRQAQHEALVQERKEATMKAREDVLANLKELMETELKCSICSELFVKATSLNCSHSYCQLCIFKWMKLKKECPICRAPFSSYTRSIVLDSFIDKMVDQLDDDNKQTRKQFIECRKEEQKKFDATHLGGERVRGGNQPGPSTSNRAGIPSDDDSVDSRERSVSECDIVIDVTRNLTIALSVGVVTGPVTVTRCEMIKYGNA